MYAVTALRDSDIKMFLTGDGAKRSSGQNFLRLLIEKRPSIFDIDEYNFAITCEVSSKQV
jgi:hypothetical protein